jgi:peptidoglycan/xylan/chitin deacetylase (PgdA/CDA1 family)
LNDRVLNLCFHGLGVPGHELEPGEAGLWIEPVRFEELVDASVRFPPVRITIDDGNASDVEFALPALRQRNLTAEFFIISGRIGRSGSLDARDIRSLVKAGMTVGSHGLSHRPWRALSTRELLQELGDAQRAIAAAAGQPVSHVACPLGSYDRRVLSVLRRCGYSRVYTVDGPPAKRDAWLQSRYTVRSDDTPGDIERRARRSGPQSLSAVLQAGKSVVKRWR